MSFDTWAAEKLPEHLAEVKACAGQQSTELLCLRRLARDAWTAATFEEKHNGLSRETYRAMVCRLVKPGDVLTHTRCMGTIEEHVYTRNDGNWLCGTPTEESLRLGCPPGDANDISPLNVTHINRVPVDTVEFMASVKQPEL